MVSHISDIVDELTAYPDRFGGASLGAVMEICDRNFVVVVVKSVTIVTMQCTQLCIVMSSCCQHLHIIQMDVSRHNSNSKRQVGYVYHSSIG